MDGDSSKWVDLIFTFLRLYMWAALFIKDHRFKSRNFFFFLAFAQILEFVLRKPFLYWYGCVFEP